MTRTNFNHKKFSRQARFNKNHLDIYKSWKKVFCPAFNKEVYFTNKGWQHIQQEKWRSREDKEKRLNMLPVAKHVLEKSTFFQESRLQKYHGTIHKHYCFRAVVGGTSYGVVVIEDSGRLDFLSVFRV